MKMPKTWSEIFSSTVPRMEGIQEWRMYGHKKNRGNPHAMDSASVTVAQWTIPPHSLAHFMCGVASILHTFHSASILLLIF